MKAVLAFALLGLVAVSALEYNPETLKAFDAWRAKFSKTYASPEAFEEAYTNFAATQRRVELKNLAQSQVRYGTTKFADLSPQQFRERYLNLNGTALKESMAKANLKVTPPQPLPAGMTQLPADFDWATQNPSPVTYPKDQGQCGSCWTFSVVENIESQYFLAGKFPNNQLVDLSEQQILDCDVNSTWGDDGCNGGYTQGAFDYVIKAGGLNTEADYPYVSGDSGGWGDCTFNKKSIAASINGWEYAVPTCNDSCTHQNATLLMQQLVAIGPFSICVVATDDWQDYEFGVLIGYCPMDAADINHGVQLTGYANGKNEGWWVVRNSWGDDWGNQGYIWVSMPNDCGVADIVTYAVVDK